MSTKQSKVFSTQNTLALGVVTLSVLAIVILAIMVIRRDVKDAAAVFNIVVPVFASWVGTVLAFYFGRENFEAANEKVTQIVNKVVGDNMSERPIATIMRSIKDVTFFQIPAGSKEDSVKLQDIKNKLKGKVTRLPILGENLKPIYIIHESSLNKYLAGNRKLTDSLKQFIETQKKAGFTFGLDRGFVVVPENEQISVARRKMEETPGCQDVFITKGGSPDEPVTGWASNLRMVKYRI